MIFEGKKMNLKAFAVALGLIKGSKRWRKSSKCKSLIKQAREHLLIQKKRRESITRQSRIDIAHLLQNGHQHIALSRVDQLYKDQRRLSAYEQIDRFCDCINTNLHDISKGCDLSKDVQEALSSLIFAASRCGEIPELNLLRCLFQQRFGQEFVRVNVQLLPWNTVNSELKQNLSTNVSSINEKSRIANEIEREYKFSSGLLINDQNSVPENHKLRNSEGKTKVESPNLVNPPVQDKSRRATNFEDMVRRIGSKVSNHEEPRFSHVHPKLPDYDNIVSKFTDHKVSYMQKRWWMWC